MGDPQVSTRVLENGVTVVVQEMAHLQSAAMTMLMPAGSVFDRPDRSGTAALLAEMMPRGVSGLSARALSSALDNLGVQRNVSAGVGHLTISAATTADRLLDAVPLICGMVISPDLDSGEFPAAQDLVRQALHALEDEPQQQLGQYLRKCSYPSPWNQPSGGTLDQIDAITCDDVRRFFDTCIRPNDTIIGVAGNVKPDDVFTALDCQFSSWRQKAGPEIHESPPKQSRMHIDHDSAQTHIGLAWPTVPYSHERYFHAWAAVSVLSGGMSSRLFTNVREKRGLCYAISASLNTLKHEARILGYAGTTNERAQETLDAMIAEIRRLHEDLTEGELTRCKAQAKSSLIMQQESTTARSSSLARDTWHLGRVRLLSEIRHLIDAITLDDVRQYALDYAPEEIVLVTIGPHELSCSDLAHPVPVAAG